MLGVAENLPFADESFDAAMAVLTMHHWRDADAGLAEMRRVARDRLVILTFDPREPYFWLADYLPQIIALDQLIMPPLSLFGRVLGDVRIVDVPIRHDCQDGFIGAYWRRPERFLDPRVRASISTFTKIDDAVGPLARLEDDLASGAWMRRYGHLLALDTLDIGYRLVIASTAKAR